MKFGPQSLLRGFVYSNVFISCCAVLMSNQTSHFLLLQESNNNYLWFVFFSTLCSYSFHWYLTSSAAFPSPRIEWGNSNKYLYGLLFVAGLAGAMIFFFRLWPYWPWLVISALITFLYSAPKIPHPYFRLLRKVALGKTIFLALVWMHVTTILPIIISHAEWKPAYTLFIIGRFCLIYAICILFDYRDRDDDKSAGIKSLITYLDEGSIFRLFVITLTIFGIVTLLLLRYAYTLPQIIVLLIPGIITAALFTYAKKNFSDLFYYLLLDGLMALSALLMMIPGL